MPKKQWEKPLFVKVTRLKEKTWGERGVTDFFVHFDGCFFLYTSKGNFKTFLLIHIETFLVNNTPWNDNYLKSV